MSQSYDVAINRRGGFTSLPEAMAHKNVVGKLADKAKQAGTVADQLRAADRVDVSSATSELNVDLAAGKGHVIMLASNPDNSTYGAELNYNPTDNSTRSFQLDVDGSKLTQMGSTFKLEENGITTYFRPDANRGTLTIMDGEADVPRIFGGIDPLKLTAGTIQSGQQLLVF